MSVGQIITQLKSLSRNDLLLIVNEAQKTLDELDPAAFNQLDLSKMPKNPEIWSPWDEYQAADDMERLLADLESEFAERVGTGTVFFNEPIILPEGTPTLRQMLEGKSS